MALPPALGLVERVSGALVVAVVREPAELDIEDIRPVVVREIRVQDDELLRPSSGRRFRELGSRPDCHTWQQSCRAGRPTCCPWCHLHRVRPRRGRRRQLGRTGIVRDSGMTGPSDAPGKPKRGQEDTQATLPSSASRPCLASDEATRTGHTVTRLAHDSPRPPPSSPPRPTGPSPMSSGLGSTCCSWASTRGCTRARPGSTSRGRAIGSGGPSTRPASPSGCSTRPSRTSCSDTASASPTWSRGRPRRPPS